MTQRTPRPERWLEAGREPEIAELVADPIAALLRRRDGIAEAEVWHAVRAGRRGLRQGCRAA